MSHRPNQFRYKFMHVVSLIFPVHSMPQGTLQEAGQIQLGAFWPICSINCCPRMERAAWALGEARGWGSEGQGWVRSREVLGLCTGVLFLTEDLIKEQDAHVCKVTKSSLLSQVTRASLRSQTVVGPAWLTIAASAQLPWWLSNSIACFSSSFSRVSLPTRALRGSAGFRSHSRCESRTWAGSGNNKAQGH